MIDVALALPEADEPEWGSVLLERRGWYLLRHGDNAAARAAYESALATLPVTAEPAVRTRVLAGSVRAYERAAEFDRALELAREAVTIAVETEASTEIGPAHYMLGRILLTIGEVDGALTELDQAARAAEETLNPVMLAIALLERGDALARRRQLADAVPAALDAAARLRARGHVDPFALLATASAAALLNRLGRPAEARALAAEILATARSPVTLAVGHLLAGAFDVEALRVDAAGEHLETARFLAAPLLDGRVGAALATARAELALVDGNATSAMGAVEEGLSRAAHTGDDEAYAHLCLLGLRIEAERNALTLGRASERARRHRDAKVDELERGLQRVLDAWPAGADRPDLAAIRSGWTAERTRLDGAQDPAAWARAVADWAAAGWPRWAAYAALGRAEALAAGSDDAAVASALDEARVAATALDSALLLVHCDRLAHRIGHDQPPAAPRAGAVEALAGTVDALTAREREVLDLVAAGATNRQIAARLFISPKTASVHVSRILTKLGVADRAEAAVLARRANRAPRG
jgi:DNA-binding CsgD family transcriptional regulator/tetratricopeptide (TPR) repeat protein